MNLKNMLKRLTSNYLSIENSNIYKLFFIVALSVEECKSLFYQISSWQGVINAEGETLDLIGEEVRQPRNGMNDEEYRHMLNFKNALNLSGTDINSVNNAMNVITEGDFIFLEEGYNSIYREPASIVLNLKKYRTNINYNKINEILAAGVRVFFIAHIETKYKINIGSSMLSAEEISILPYQISQLDLKCSVFVASACDLSVEQTTVYPFIFKLDMGFNFDVGFNLDELI